MQQIKMTVDMDGVLKSFGDLRRMLTGIDTMGRVLQHAASAIWVPNIKQRLLNNETATSMYRNELQYTMNELDPEFVKKLGNASGWADRTEQERRVKGGYAPGEITQKLSNAIAASIPAKTPGSIAVGIADVDLLTNLLPHIDRDSKFKIWQILQWGTGIYAPNGKAVIRTGKQLFFDRKSGQGILIQSGSPHASNTFTENPGFRGREYFVQLDGSIHESDYFSRDYVLKYMRRMIKKYKYNRG